MKKGRAEYKWRFAMGTTSRVPNSKLHYLIADYDCSEQVPYPGLRLGLIAGYKPDHIFIQKTPNGWHVYTDIQMTFKKLTEALAIVGADRKWVEIGKTRGYFFLADKGPVTLPWPVERMQIHATRKVKGR